VTTALPLDRAAIEAILPHREPFLLIDEVLELEPGERVVALKRVRGDEWFFRGHFPGRPVMPGVLIVEAMAQTGAVAVLSEEENRGRIALFAGIDDTRFKRIVEPGDELELSCELERVRGPIGKGRAEARALGEHVKRLKIPIGEVLASPFCRTMETARLAFGKARATGEVRGGPLSADDPARYAPLRELLSSRVPENENLVIASHGNPFRALAGPPYLAEGEMAVVRPEGGGRFSVIARIRLTDW